MPNPAASPCSTPPATAFLPTTMAECKARGWNEVDVVFVSGDAYIDHPSFAAALLGRVLTGNKAAIDSGKLKPVKDLAEWKPNAKDLTFRRRAT